MTTEATTTTPPAGIEQTPSRAGDAAPSLLGQPASPAYEAFRLPEGMGIDDQEMEQATRLFQEARLDQMMAQRFVDHAMGRERAALQRGLQAFVDLQNKWTGEIKADPDIGGAKLAATLSSAARAIDRLGVPGLREALNVTGAGNHPAIVRAFARLGQMLSEDRFQPGRDAAPAAPRSPAEVIYDGTPRR